MRKRILIATASGILLSLLGIALSTLVGVKNIPLDDVLHTLSDYQETFHDQLTRDVRLLCALSALLTGGLLVTSDVMMQGISCNPIAEPSTLDITQGSVTFVAIAPMLPLLTVTGNLWTVFADAGFSGLLVLLFAVKYAGHPNVSRILLAGSALSIFLSSAASLSAFIQLSLIHVFEPTRP